MSGLSHSYRNIYHHEMLGYTTGEAFARLVDAEAEQKHPDFSPIRCVGVVKMVGKKIYPYSGSVTFSILCKLEKMYGWEPRLSRNSY